MAEEKREIHRVAAIVWLDLPARDYDDATTHADTAVGRWLDVQGITEIPLWYYDGRPAGVARIAGVDTLGQALGSGRLLLRPPLRDTPTAVYEAHARLVQTESETRGGTDG